MARISSRRDKTGTEIERTVRTEGRRDKSEEESEKHLEEGNLVEIVNPLAPKKEWAGGQGGNKKKERRRRGDRCFLGGMWGKSASMLCS